MSITTALENHKFKNPYSNDYSKIIDYLLKTIGYANKFYVEIGCNDTIPYDNTRFLKELNWNGIWIDSCDTVPILDNDKKVGTRLKNKSIKIHHVTKENINSLFKQYYIPNSFDFLCLDLGLNDFWIWKELTYTPDLVMIPYNPYIPSNVSKIIEYDSNALPDGSQYFGASFKSMIKLAKEKYYTLVYTSNYYMFFIKDYLFELNFKPIKDINTLFNPPKENPPLHWISEKQMIKY